LPIELIGTDQKLIIAGANFHGKMFEPEYQADIDCPQCLRRQVYFDRGIGFYCMSCGHEFVSEEALMLIQKTTLISQLTHTSGKGEGKPLRLPIVERPPLSRTSKSKIESLSGANPMDRNSEMHN